MFCNGPKTDEGDIARLEPTTITGMTILKVLFVLDHDFGRYRWFGWARQTLLGILSLHIFFQKCFLFRLLEASLGLLLLANDNVTLYAL